MSKKNNEAAVTEDASEIVEAVLATETMTGDMRDFILDRLKNEKNKRPWDEQTEAQQRQTVREVTLHCGDMVRRAVELIAAQGRKSIKATVEQITVKDGIKATLTLSKYDEQRHVFIDAQGASVLIVVADPEEFTGERGPVAIKPDQASMIGDAGVVHSDPDTSVH